MKLRKEEARKSLKQGDCKDLEINEDDYFESDLEFPKRPSWSYDMSPQELDKREQRYFSVVACKCL